MRIDVNAFIGTYPWRHVPRTRPDELVAEMERLGITEGWVTFVPALYWADPMEGNAHLVEALAPFDRLRAIPVVHPGLPHWQETVHWARAAGAPALRADPSRQALDPAGPEMQALAHAAAAAGLPLLLATRLEDLRQRHPLDRAPDLTAAAIRRLLRADTEVRLIVTHADREMIEQVHFGSTAAEARRILWDISWIWGPPEDHLALLLETIGPDRFVFGTGQPLRLPETPIARLDLSLTDPTVRRRIESENLLVWRTP